MTLSSYRSAVVLLSPRAVASHEGSGAGGRVPNRTRFDARRRYVSSVFSRWARARLVLALSPHDARLRQVLSVLAFMVGIAVIVYSAAVFSFEQSGANAADFESIPRTFW